MPWKPITLYNPTNEEIEWYVGGIRYFLGAHKREVFDGFVADHALNYTNTGLVEYEPESVEEVEESHVGYEKLPWRELVKLASKEGVFKPGMKKDELLKALNER